MNVNIFLLCFNEERIIPHTIKHYRDRIPNCKITIYDNMSTDNSVLLAKNNNCEVITFDTNGENNVYIKRDIFNKCWKNVRRGWIIVADMDEWLDITMDDLNKELIKGTSIISTKGCDMIGESNSVILDDIDLHKINKYILNTFETKNICFLREKIINMNYTVGHHKCTPVGKIIYSSSIYNIKHMNYLGLPYIMDKVVNRYNRSKSMQKKNLSIHYTNNLDIIKEKYNHKLNNSNNYN